MRRRSQGGPQETQDIYGKEAIPGNRTRWPDLRRRLRWSAGNNVFFNAAGNPRFPRRRRRPALELAVALENAKTRPSSFRRASTTTT